jgi:hypothetical protein
VINNRVHICTWPIGPFNLELKCSFMMDFHMVFLTMLSTLRRPKPQIGGVVLDAMYHSKYLCVMGCM